MLRWMCEVLGEIEKNIFIHERLGAVLIEDKIRESFNKV